MNAPHFIQPAAVAYWSALHYRSMTEQVPLKTKYSTGHTGASRLRIND